MLLLLTTRDLVLRYNKVQKYYLITLIIRDNVLYLFQITCYLKSTLATLSFEHNNHLKVSH